MILWFFVMLCFAYKVGINFHYCCVTVVRSHFVYFFRFSVKKLFIFDVCQWCYKYKNTFPFMMVSELRCIFFFPFFRSWNLFETNDSPRVMTNSHIKSVELFTIIISHYRCHEYKLLQMETVRFSQTIFSEFVRIRR